MRQTIGQKPDTSQKPSTQQLFTTVLTRDQYKELEKRFPTRLTDNAITAAQYLGQQEVLKAVRDGFTQG